MFKKLSIFLLTGFALLSLAGQAYAAKMVTIRINQPTSPVNQNSFNVSFEALDLLGRTVTVKCFQQGPADAGFSQFGASQTFSNGGNSGVCSVDGSVVNDGQGTYSFRVEATAGDGTGDNFDSETTSITYDTSGPGDVLGYSKNKTNSCEYTIHFQTANDSGQTVKVELYRSDVVPFNADHNSRIQSIPIGSNEARDTTDTIPDCNKTYYYAVRAFDSAGNGSALVGDNVSNITVINPTGSQAQGAIPVTGAGTNLGGSVLGLAGSSGPTGTAGGETLGDTQQSSEAAEVTSTPAASSTSSTRNFAIFGLVALLVALGYYLLKRRA